MSLRAIAPGPLATVQDGGRHGFRAFGVPVSGPFDRASAAIANAMVGNAAGTTVLELTGFGGTYEAESEVAIGLAGASMTATVEPLGAEGRTLAIPCAIGLRPGDHLILGASRIGFRLYLAARGGWRVPTTLGSHSCERSLVAGDRLPAERSRTAGLWTRLGVIAGDDAPVRFLSEPDVPRDGLDALECLVYRIGQHSDRMGIRLEGDPIAIDSPAERLSAPVAPGTIQLAGGLPIVLGPACGTMGGYPNVGHVVSADLDRVGQCRPGDLVRFRQVEIEEARRIDRAYRANLRGLALRLALASCSIVEPS